ncbi:hypothetical protein SAMN04488037_105259 [Shimia marina]|uniref:Uncharacterized protein n=1 Tax=Shimia marina TaxID=321267 RepID=A0A0P1FFZ3_9RHOB|nr:hypothetical protein SHM7688_01934 [Shimia marina]SFE13155.1 hypothetical protein SAMN04488037_105259 [Shimia marina]
MRVKSACNLVASALSLHAVYGESHLYFPPACAPVGNRTAPFVTAHPPAPVTKGAMRMFWSALGGAQDAF